MFPRLQTKLTATILLLTFGLSACSLPFGPAAATPTPALTSTPAPPTATPVPAAATVNGEIIALSEYESELARYKSAQAALGKTVTEEKAAQTVFDDLVDQALLAQGARAAGLGVDESALQSRVDALAASLGGADQLVAWESAHGYDDASFRVALKRSIEAASMRDKIIADVPRTMEQVHARQILLYNANDAQNVLSQLKAGMRTFDEMAALESETRGELGWFPQGYLLEPAIETAAFALQPGQFSDVVQTQVGFHIIYVVAREQHQLSPDALLAMQENALRAWLEQKRTEAAIVISP